MNLLEEAKKLISFRTVSEEGTKSLVHYLEPFCKRLGFQTTLQDDATHGYPNDINLIAFTKSDGSDLCPRGLLWVTHLDTVPPGNSTLWTKTGGNPFQATILGDRIYGLGSADTKLDFLCKLAAIERVGLKNIRIPFALIGTFGEEKSLGGARLLKDSGLVHPRFVLVSEPSELHPVAAHKGMLYMKAVLTPPSPLAGEGWGEGEQKIFHGRAAHGSMPHLGENAILKALAWLDELIKEYPTAHLTSIEGGTVHNIVPDHCQLSWQKAPEGASPGSQIIFLQKFLECSQKAEALLIQKKEVHFDPPQTTLNVGVIRTKEKTLEIEFDFRLIPNAESDALITLFKKLECDVKGARIEVIRSNQPLSTSEDSELAVYVKHALSDVGLQQTFLYKSGNTEGAIFNEMGAQSIVIGPGKSVGNIHAPNEYNEMSQLKKAVEFYTAFLQQFC